MFGNIFRELQLLSVPIHSSRGLPLKLSLRNLGKIFFKKINTNIGKQSSQIMHDTRCG